MAREGVVTRLLGSLDPKELREALEDFWDALWQAPDQSSLERLDPTQIEELKILADYPGMVKRMREIILIARGFALDAGVGTLAGVNPDRAATLRQFAREQFVAGGSVKNVAKALARHPLKPTVEEARQAFDEGQADSRSAGR